MNWRRIKPRSHRKVPERMVPRSLAAGLGVLGMALLIVGAVLAQATPYYGWTAPPEFQELKNPVPTTAESLTAGREIFEGRCMQCHGEKGDGEGESAESLRLPPGDLTDKKRMSGYTDGTLFWKIQVGRGEMPPWQLVLQEQEIWHVVNYIRGFTRSQ